MKVYVALVFVTFFEILFCKRDFFCGGSLKYCWNDEKNVFQKEVLQVTYTS